MLMTILLLIVLFVVGLAAVPLMIGIVPPNPYYAWPTGPSPAKAKAWMQVNRFAGRVLVGAALIAAAALMVYNGTLLRSGFLQLVFVLVVLAIAVGAILYYTRRIAG